MGLGLADPLDADGVGDVVGPGTAEALPVTVPELGLALGDGLAFGVEIAVALALDVGVPVAAGAAPVVAGDVRARRRAREGCGEVTALCPGTASDTDRAAVLTSPCAGVPGAAGVTLATQGFTGGGEEGWLTRNTPSMDEANEIPTTVLTAEYVTCCVLIDAPSMGLARPCLTGCAIGLSVH